MTETEKGSRGEIIVKNLLTLKGYDDVVLTEYHDCYDVLVKGICKLEVKYSTLNEIDQDYNFCLPRLPRSDYTVLICENWKTFVIPSHKLKVKHLRLSNTSNQFNMYQDKFSFVSDYIHAVEKIGRGQFSDAMKIVRGE